jgi:hypothetical protein
VGRTQGLRSTGRLAANLRFARARFEEGGTRLVLRCGLAKAARLTRVPRSRRALRSTVLDAEDLAAVFDAEWYSHRYGLAPADRGAGAVGHFQRIGRRHGLSANPEAHDVAPEGTSPLHGALAETVYDDFDAAWYVTQYPEVGILTAQGATVSPLWHYLTEGAHEGNSPNAWFDEQWYLRTNVDVALSKSMGGVPSGFAHFQQFGREERRAPSGAAQPSSELLDGLSNPVGLKRLELIERALTPFAYRIYPPTGTPRVNFLLPTFDKALMFGGYIAGLNFLNRLLERGTRVRVLITDDVRANADRLGRQFAGHALGTAVLERAEVVNISRRAEQLDISTDDRFLAYSMWTARHADLLSRAVGRRFVFFIQEYEPTFHHHDSWHAVGASAYDKPHFAIFNDPMLRRYFRDQRLGVFREGEDAGLRNSVVFQHALSVAGAPTAAELSRSDESRRLLLYGRPEAHAARNLFEVAVTGLRQAVANDVFDDDWVFDGVGSLRTEATLRLGRGKVLNLTTRLPLGDYVSSLRGYDVGLSLQYAPHPGVVHFEMAACGMAVVTNTFSNRSAADLREISANLLGVEPTPDGVAAGLADAVARADDLEARAKSAVGPWVNDWAESFNDDVMSAVDRELGLV